MDKNMKTVTVTLQMRVPKKATVSDVRKYLISKLDKRVVFVLDKKGGVEGYEISLYRHRIEVFAP